MSKDLIVLRGIPGSGKSSVAELFGSKAICTADDYFEDEQGNYNFDPTKLKDAHADCQMRCGLYMENGNPKIIVANTSTVAWEMEVYEKLAAKYGYRVYHLIVENRHGGKNSHGVPEEAIQKMKDRFEITL